MNTSIFKALDIRGTYPDDINEETAIVIGKACARMLPEGEIIIAHDVRHGSPELAQAVSETLQLEAKTLHKNITVREVGLSSTPMFYFLVNHFKAAGGCMITASHNPKNYNGMKIVREEAQMIPGIETLDVITKNNLA